MQSELCPYQCIKKTRIIGLPVSETRNSLVDEIGERYAEIQITA